MAELARPQAPAKPIRCLVIQLARLGDTLQSLMALRAAKQLYPNLEITFVARDRFAAAAKRIPWIEKVVTLPSDAILGPVLNGTGSEKEALGLLARWVSPLIPPDRDDNGDGKGAWDFIVNWSYSDASSWLAALLPAKQRMGFTRRSGEPSFTCSDGWSGYIQAVIQGGIPQNIHLTDILTTQLLTALQISAGEPASDGNAPVTSKSFFSLQLKEIEADWCTREFVSRKFIGIQLGAGREEKIWPAESWAKVAAKIITRHPECSVVLLGGKDDMDRAAAFRAQLKIELGVSVIRNVISLVGNSSFDLWASVVSRCNWLLAGDTAAIHLASVLGTRVLNVSLGQARWSETGPYGNGHYIVSPIEPGATLDPDTVYGTWAYASNEWSHRRNLAIETHFEKLGMAGALTAGRIHRSKIRSTSDGGGVFYEPLIKKALRLDDWVSMALGHMARSWYCGWVPPAAAELSRDMLDPSMVKSLRELDESSQVLIKICEQARQTATQLSFRSTKLKSQKLMGLRDRQEIDTLGARLAELDGLIERLGQTHAPLLGFSRLSKVLMHNLGGTSLVDLGKESAEAYRQLLEGAAILREWIKATQAISRPMAILAPPANSAGATAPVPIAGPKGSGGPAGPGGTRDLTT